MDVTFGGSTNSLIESELATPLRTELYTAFDFVIYICGILSLLFAYRVYDRWQKGEEVIDTASKWFFGFIVVIAMITAVVTMYQLDGSRVNPKTY